ncbi:hypothetical protein HMPREF1870_00026 [Bacteroidales bacterium KA00344]|nr:hypothetical protein HMPREF1870_00026 [Bacteroidales bacterium KA00344]
MIDKYMKNKRIEKVFYQDFMSIALSLFRPSYNEEKYGTNSRWTVQITFR